MSLALKEPRIKCALSHLLAVWLQASFLTFLSLTFLKWKRRKINHYNGRIFVSVKWDRAAIFRCYLAQHLTLSKHWRKGVCYSCYFIIIVLPTRRAGVFPPVGMEPNSWWYGFGFLPLSKSTRDCQADSQLAAIPLPGHKLMNLIHAHSLGGQGHQWHLLWWREAHYSPWC